MLLCGLTHVNIAAVYHIRSNVYIHETNATVFGTVTYAEVMSTIGWALINEHDEDNHVSIAIGDTENMLLALT